MQPNLFAKMFVTAAVSKRTRSQAKSNDYIEHVQETESVSQSSGNFGQMPVAAAAVSKRTRSQAKSNDAQHLQITAPFQSKELAVVLKNIPAAKKQEPVKHSKKLKDVSKRLVGYNSTDAPPKVGDLCYGKIRGHLEWPCHVLSVDIEKKFAWVEFFNAADSEKL